MTVQSASGTAGQNTVCGKLDPERAIDITALHAARNETCSAYGPLRRLLVHLLLENGAPDDQVSDEADRRIDIARRAYLAELERPASQERGL
ncbi:hypothetical protein AB0C10_16050 [Microbispora amethystogenes]|uniref:hypothetical protein n=1 Tax=Microbispora amethystogenes TaxID=1427754 RepID=UPI00340410AD